MMNLYDAGYGGDLPDSMYGSDLYLSEEERKKKQATQPLPPGVAPYQGQQAVNKTPEPQKQEPQAATGVVQPAEPAPTFAELQAQGKEIGRAHV